MSLPVFKQTEAMAVIEPAIDDRTSFRLALVTSEIRSMDDGPLIDNIPLLDTRTYRRIFDRIETMMLIRQVVESRPGAGKKRAPMSPTLLESELTCPVCGYQDHHVMPTDACLFFHECVACETLLRPKPGDCCVFCSYGTVPCPPVQENGSCRSGQ